MSRALLLCLVALSCTRHVSQATVVTVPTCSSLAPKEALPPTPEAVAKLEGHFQLFATDTANGFVSRDGDRLELRRPDSLLIAEWRERQARSGLKPERWVPRLVAVRAANDAPRWNEDIDVRGATLALGACPLYMACMDGNPVYFMMDRVSSHGAWGHWMDLQQGMGRLVNSATGKLLANPAGYFCLLRSVETPTAAGISKPAR